MNQIKDKIINLKQLQHIISALIKQLEGKLKNTTEEALINNINSNLAQLNNFFEFILKRSATINECYSMLFHPLIAQHLATQLQLTGTTVEELHKEIAQKVGLLEQIISDEDYYLLEQELHQYMGENYKKLFEQTADLTIAIDNSENPLNEQSAKTTEDHKLATQHKRG